MQIFGYFASLLIGISLGLIGGGGSILTVPVLVYLFSVSPTLATSYSLLIVGSTSLVGAFNNYLKGFVRIKTALLFGTASISTVFLTRKFLIAHIPEKIGTMGNFLITRNMLTMVLFAILMVLASLSMMKSKKNVISKADAKPLEDKEEKNLIEAADKKINIPKLLFYGIVIGIVTGLLGAGGGFLLIPTLVLLVKLPMKEAVGTSLFIIALNSLIGFTGDLGHFTMDWFFLFIITSIAIAGIFIGGFIGKKVSGEQLKKGFGWFVLVMGTYIIVKEIFF